MFVSALFTIVKTRKQPKFSWTDEWIKKKQCVYTHTLTHTQTYRKEYYSTIKNDWSVAICRNTDGLGGHYAKWNKSEKDKYHMISLICGI